MSEAIYRRVMCNDRLPMRVAKSYLTDIGNATFWGDNAWSGLTQDMPEWWLEEIELPSEIEIKEMAEQQWGNVDRVGKLWFINGFNKAIELIKGKK